MADKGTTWQGYQKNEQRKLTPNVAVFAKRAPLLFLQELFKERPPGSFKYDSDDTKTEIQISDQHTVNLDVVHHKPSIVAVRGPISSMNMGLGGNGLESRPMTSGDRTYNDLLSGSIAFSCYSREGIEAENIAFLVFNSFKLFKPILREAGFFTIKSVNIGAEALIESGAEDELYMVPVYVSLQIQDRWSLTDAMARKVKDIIISCENHL